MPAIRTRSFSRALDGKILVEVEPQRATADFHEEVFDILCVHARQGGLCLVPGEPGTGKSILKQSLLPRLSPEAIEQFILDQLDRAGLGHKTFSAEALALIVRSGEGLLRLTRNLCLSALVEAVRDQSRIVDSSTSTAS